MNSYFFIALSLLVVGTVYAAESDAEDVDIQDLNLPQNVTDCLKIIKPLELAFGECMVSTNADMSKCKEGIDIEVVWSCQGLCYETLDAEQFSQVEALLKKWAKWNDWLILLSVQMP